MAIFKCKMCGGDLNVEEGAAVCECEYCGTSQTVPGADSEKKTNLFNRANRLRMGSEFDKAAGIYESIIAEFPEEAEAYWGLCLCKYGIEYVDDPSSAKKIPTCHRTSYEGIFDDANFELALEYADAVAVKLYRSEAKEIDRLQKAILEIAQKEEPFDVFICYKETDEAGERTVDSVLAQDIYTALTEKGYKVFFSRITLEDKLGQEYEPYIFAALSSARIMLAVGTQYDYYNAVWVKNEWNRFLAMMKEDSKKVLIPCYRDIDAYDMPKEFRSLQGQDMSRLGFLQDLLRGVEKILPKNAEKAQLAQMHVQAAEAQPATDSLLRRAELFLEDGAWADAEEYCNRALDADPECARAYFYMLLAGRHIRNKDKSDKYSDADGFAADPNFQKALRFADDSFRAELERINKQVIYNEAEKFMSCAVYAKAKKGFAAVAGFKDADVKAAECSRLEAEAMEALRPIRESLPSGILSAGGSHTIGLKSDGTVAAVGKNYNGRCDVSDWGDIVAISAGGLHTVGLKSDGTVVAVGLNNDGQCNVSDWRDIVAISACWRHTVGLKSDGSVAAVGNNEYGQCNVSDWGDIVAISAGGSHTVGLKSDGTVAAVGLNDDGQCNVSDWGDIVAISAGGEYTVGLKSDGTVVAVGENKEGQCNVGGLTDIETRTPDAIKEVRIEERKKAEQARIEERKKAEQTRIEERKKAEQARIEERKKIEQANQQYRAEIAELEKQLKGQTAIYEANRGKLFGAGAKARKAAKSEIDRLNEQIEIIKSKIR